MIYIVKMDNPDDPDDFGIPTRVRLVGPFPHVTAASTWAASSVNNPHDNPCWQVVDLESAVVEVVAP